MRTAAWEAERMEGGGDGDRDGDGEILTWWGGYCSKLNLRDEDE